MHHTVPAAGMQISPEMLKSVSSMMSSMSPEMMQSMMSMASSSGAASAPGAPAASGQQTAPGRFFIATSPESAVSDDSKLHLIGSLLPHLLGPAVFDGGMHHLRKR